MRRRAEPAPFARWLQDQGPAEARTLHLVDVGCRGGPPHWLRVWPGGLVGVGVDPDPDEVGRLDAAREWPGMRWSAGWVGDAGWEAGLPAGFGRAEWRSWNNRTWRRTSSEVAQRVLAEAVPPGDPGQQAEPPAMITLDALAGTGAVDVLKVDTDGHDLEVLNSGPQVLERALAVDVEVQLQGAAHPRANTFGNIDRLLRDAGFELFDLRLNRHSRAALPAPSWGGGGSPTRLGQTVWGEALYLRDVVATPWAALGARGWTLAALFELAGLPDCAVELIHAGHVPGAGGDAARALGRSWWRDGGAAALGWLHARPDRLALPGLPRLRDRARRLPTEWLWAPWRG